MRNAVFVKRVAQIHEINSGVREKVIAFRAPNGAQISGEHEELVREMPEPAIAVLQRERAANIVFFVRQ